MKATARHIQPVDAGQVPFASSLVLSIFLHSALVLWLIGSAWLLSRMQPYRLSSHTVFLGGDSPFAIDQIPGEGGGGAGAGAKQAPKAPEPALPAVQAEAGAELSVEKFAPPMEKRPPPAPKPVVEKPLEALPPKPVIEKAAPPPPKPVVEKPVPPTPAPKPVVEKAVSVPPKPPPEAMTLAHKETKPTTPPAPPPTTATEVQQKVAQLRERQAQQEAKTATEAQQTLTQLRQKQAAQEQAEQRVASLRAEQAEQAAAQQRVAALRARVSNDSAGEGTAGTGKGTAGTGSGSGLPGGGRGTGTAGAGGVGTGGLGGIRLRNYQTLVQEKVRNAWSVPPQSKGLQATVFLTIDRAGHVEQFHFVQRSGNALFDESLQRAIKQAEPLPPLPEDYTGRSLEAELRFRPRD